MHILKLCGRGPKHRRAFVVRRYSCSARVLREYSATSMEPAYEEAAPPILSSNAGLEAEAPAKAEFMTSEKTISEILECPVRFRTPWSLRYIVFQFATDLFDTDLPRFVPGALRNYMRSQLLWYDMLVRPFSQSRVEFCINKWMEKKHSCPVCNHDARPVHPSWTLRTSPVQPFIYSTPRCRGACIQEVLVPS